MPACAGMTIAKFSRCVPGTTRSIVFLISSVLMTKNRFLIQGGKVTIFRAPLKEPFITALGRHDAAVNVRLELRLSGGAQGYGEASSSLVAKHLKPAALVAALRTELRRGVGRDARELRSIVTNIWRRLSDLAPAAAAIECALTDALCRELGVTMLEWFGGAKCELETDLTLSAAGPDVAGAAAARAIREGFRILKLK